MERTRIDSPPHTVGTTLVNNIARETHDVRRGPHTSDRFG